MVIRRIEECLLPFHKSELHYDTLLEASESYRYFTDGLFMSEQVGASLGDRSAAHCGNRSRIPGYAWTALVEDQLLPGLQRFQDCVPHPRVPTRWTAGATEAPVRKTLFKLS